MAPHAEFQLVAGHPALDFVNTVDWRWNALRRRWDPVRGSDAIDGFDDLVGWARQAAIVTAAAARTLTATAARDPLAASRALRRARRLRDALGRIFEAAGRGQRPTTRDLRRFNAVLGATLQRRRLELRGLDYAWAWSAGDDSRLDAFLAPIALAAADLLASPQRVRIRACAAGDCGWLFVDTSRGGRRRWCTMQRCGNRAKARRFYARAVASSGA